MSGALSVLLSSVPAATVTVAPLSIDASGAATFYTFASCTITVAGGVPSSYLWTFDDPQFGFWSVFSGQGTATAVARVAAVLGQDTATAGFMCAVVIGSQTYYRTASLSFFNTNPAP